MKRYKPLKLEKYTSKFFEGKKQALQILKNSEFNSKDVVDFLEDLDPTKNNKYVEILAKILKNDFKSLKDFEKQFKKDKIYDKIKELENKSQTINLSKINLYKDFVSKITALSQVITQGSRSKGIKGLKENVDYIKIEIEDDDYQAFIPLSWEASKVLGSNKVGKYEGKWCTAYQKDNSYWVSYIVEREGTLIYFINMNDEVDLDRFDKFAIISQQDTTRYDMFDKEDKSFRINDLPEHELIKIVNYSLKELGRKWEHIRKTLDVENYPISLRTLKLMIEEDKDLSNLNVSEITNMNEVFNNTKFNGDISNWDVSNVETMDNMFSDSAFNGDISNWDVSKVTNMTEMFHSSEFNRDISKWNVSKVQLMYRMFFRSKFNGNISNWDVSGLVMSSDAFKMSPLENNEPYWYER